jgi:hypothetical protein
VDARREVLLGYHYALHRQAKQLEKEKKGKLEEGDNQSA